MKKNIFLLVISLFIIDLKAQSINDSLAIELDNFIMEKMLQNNIPGLAACIVKENQVVWKSTYGFAHIENNIPVSLNTKFTLASISKLFTATACAQLSEQGNLDLDVDINTYLPIEIKNPNFPEIPITTRQLLTHRSSLHDFESDLQLWDAPGDPIYDLDFFCSAYFLEDGPLYNSNNFGNTAPGNSDYWYSNAGFTLLGYIVQEVSGQPFNQFVQQNILTPIEMTTSGWFFSEVDSNDIAMPYNTGFEPFGYYSLPEYPAATLKSSINELSNFLLTYTQKGVFGEMELVNPNTFNEIVPLNMVNGFGWWGTDTWWGDPEGAYWSHGGFMNGVRTQLNYYPFDSTGLIILTNGEGSYSAIQNKLESYIPLFETDVISSNKNIDNLSISIYPNPAKEHIYIENRSEFLQELQIEIINTTGKRTTSTTSFKSTTSIPTANLSAGKYYIKIISRESIFYYPLVIFN